MSVIYISVLILPMEAGQGCNLMNYFSSSDLRHQDKTVKMWVSSSINQSGNEYCLFISAFFDLSTIYRNHQDGCASDFKGVISVYKTAF